MILSVICTFTHFCFSYPTAMDNLTDCTSDSLPISLPPALWLQDHITSCSDFLWAPDTHTQPFTQYLLFDILNIQQIQLVRMKTMLLGPSLFLALVQNPVLLCVSYLREWHPCPLRCAGWKPRSQPSCFYLPVTSISPPSPVSDSFNFMQPLIPFTYLISI